MKILLICAILFISAPQGADAFFIGSFFTSLGEWIKGIFVSIWTWFANLILSIGKAIIKSIQDMVQDILTDFSTAGELTRQNLNATMTKAFGADLFNTTNLLLKLMYVGDLPIQYYLSPVDIEDEFKLLDDVIFKLRSVTFVNLAINLMFIVINILLYLTYRTLNRSFTILKTNETKFVEKLKR